MRKILRAAACVLVSIATTWAGALYLEVGNPDANPEARTMKALIVARATACHEPAKSVVTASAIEASGTGIRRTALQVVPLKTPGMFAVIGNAPEGSLIDLAVTNPEYKNYEPRVLIRQSARRVEWGSVRHFFSKPPSDAEVRELLAASD